jgi:hypothetical protein
MAEDEKNPQGRKRFFETPQDFIDKAEAYFLERVGKKVSWTGLCLSVGVSSRQGLERYKRGEHGDGFVDPIKKALLRVENYYEEGENAAKDIFALKNFGWSDKQELEHTGPNGGPIQNQNINSEMSPREAAQHYTDMLKNND